MLTPLDYNYITSSDRGDTDVSLLLSPQYMYLLFLLVNNLYETRNVSFTNKPDEDTLEAWLTELLDKLMTDEAADMWNVGDYKDISHDVIPDKWLLCEGQSLLRDDYPDLFDLIGTTYGSADGTHFNIPDFRMRSPMGAGALGGNAELYGTYDIGFVAGDIKNIILIENMPAHSHQLESTTTGSNLTNLIWSAAFGGNTPAPYTTYPVGGDVPFSVLHPVAIVNRIIKVLP